MKNVVIKIEGKVFEVGFRYYVKQMAENFDILGTVRYNKDQSIEIEASGQENSLDKFISYCRLGSLGSEVRQISISDSIPKTHSSFEILDN